MSGVFDYGGTQTQIIQILFSLKIITKFTEPIELVHTAAFKMEKIVKIVFPLSNIPFQPPWQMYCNAWRFISTICLYRPVCVCACSAH